MNIRKLIRKTILENNNLPWGGEYLSDAPYNQEEPKFRQGTEVTNNEFTTVWVGYNAGIALLKDKNNKLYAFLYADEDDFEPYGDREIIGTYPDGDGGVDVEYADFEINKKAVDGYVNDNLNSLTRGAGMVGYNDGDDLVLVDQELKAYLIDNFSNYLKHDKDSFLSVLEKQNISENKKSIRLYTRLLENFNPTVDSEEIKSRIEMVIDPNTRKVSMDDLQDIANEYNMNIDSDEFMNLYSYVSSEAEKDFRQELESDVQWVIDEHFQGEAPNDFEEFFNIFKTIKFDNRYSISEVKNEFDSLKNDPNQLSLFEGVKDPETFVKVVFNSPLSDSRDRLELMGIIKNFHGEPLKKENKDRDWSTYIPKIDLDGFVKEAFRFNPESTASEIQGMRFKPLKYELEGGQEITFRDYSVSQANAPLVKGYIKPGFIKDNMALMKWDGGNKEKWIEKNLIDKYYFYHGDASDIKGHKDQMSVDDYKNVKIFFDESEFEDMSLDRAKELKNLIVANKGSYKYVFGRNRASGGQRYAIIPKEKADDFIQSAYDFGAFEGETEQNLTLEKNNLQEIRKAIRTLVKKNIDKI